MTSENHALAALRIYYVDDSGDGRSSAVFGALGIDLEHHDRAERTWRRFRTALAVDQRLLIPAHHPLHAVELIAARGRYVHRSRSTDRREHRRHSAEVVLRGLGIFAGLPGVRTMVVHRRTSDYGRDRPLLYRRLLSRIQADLVASDRFGVVVIDGDGTESALRRAHRELPDDDRRLLGDPMFQSARQVGLLQAADFLAHLGFQNVAQKESHHFCWKWLLDAAPEVDGPLEL